MTYRLLVSKSSGVLVDASVDAVKGSLRSIVEKPDHHTQISISIRISCTKCFILAARLYQLTERGVALAALKHGVAAYGAEKFILKQPFQESR